jgi:hypothetical protein
VPGATRWTGPGCSSLASRDRSASAAFCSLTSRMVASWASSASARCCPSRLSAASADVTNRNAAPMAMVSTVLAGFTASCASETASATTTKGTPAPPSRASHARGRRAQAGQPTGAATPRLRLRPGCAVASAACTASSGVRPPRPPAWCWLQHSRARCRPGAAGVQIMWTRSAAAACAVAAAQVQARARLLTCQARARRAASIAELIATVTPSASSRPSHGWSSKALPPSRPIRNA